MKKLLSSAAILLAFLFLTCGSNSNPIQSVAEEYDGRGKIVFQDEDLNYGRPIEVYTYIPESYSTESKVLFVIHGSSRNPIEYREAWLGIANQYNVLLLCPNFSAVDGFPDSHHFNMGNMFEMDEDDIIIAETVEDDWSFSLIDPIFEYMKSQMGNNSIGYYIYGHSAGSQFVHRMLFFKPEAKVIKAVCANAGWYTMPDLDILFPYGMKGTGANKEILSAIFSKDMTVLLGDQDTDTESSSLRQTPEAMEQGIHRLERGNTFFALAEERAEDWKVDFHWKLQIVEGIGHSNSLMAPYAGEVLFH